jgi:hypothetical protein
MAKRHRSREVLKDDGAEHLNRRLDMSDLVDAVTGSAGCEDPTPSAQAWFAENFLDKQPLDLGEVREALDCIVNDADRAGDIIDRIRDHIKKAPPRKARFDLSMK